MRRPLPLVLAAAALSACATFASLRSQTTIEPGRSFLLGGGQPGAFFVRGANSGPVAVSIFVDRNGVRDSVTTVAPGEAIDAGFPATSMAVFRNTSTTSSAVVTVTVTGDTRALGMRYEANQSRP